MQPATRWPAQKPIFFGPARPGPFRVRAGTARAPCPCLGRYPRPWADPARHRGSILLRPLARGSPASPVPPLVTLAPKSPIPFAHSLGPSASAAPPGRRRLAASAISDGERRPARPHPLPPPASRLPFRLL
ncbi:hypothetical protein PVAP13_2NG418003 [Panicum virgatum]|uniref:Uncharacterized protein n=1 Tax=Panicum virgatum TaxID=38727 RepID=A0A8T0VMC2_PANVG|nr:hypothetical protein PVAP13_2NG418003 [Panicum virgatum]